MELKSKFIKYLKNSYITQTIIDLLIYGLFDKAVSNTDCMASNE